MAHTLGERLAEQMVEDQQFKQQFAVGDFYSRSRIHKITLRFNTSWKAYTRSGAYAFTIGDDTNSQLDVTTVGKGPWTEVATSAD